MIYDITGGNHVKLTQVAHPQQSKLKFNLINNCQRIWVQPNPNGTLGRTNSLLTHIQWAKVSPRLLEGIAAVRSPGFCQVSTIQRPPFPSLPTCEQLPHPNLPPLFSHPISRRSTMGQLFSSLQDKFQGKQWKERRIRTITDRAFDRIRADSDREYLTFEDLYIAVLYVYNDINKFLPGRHNDPPSKEKLKAMMEEYDVNLDGLLDREEFAKFIQKLTSDALKSVGQNLLIALVVAPTVALLTKRATEGVPGIGKVTQRIPNSVYASIVVLGVVLVQKSSEGNE